jgi:hypothetical protein
MKSQGWDSYEKAAEKGPLSLGVKIVLGLFVLSLLIGALGIPLGWFGEAKQVARETVGPRAAVRKYEWFKDAQAQLAKKQADIALYETQLAEMKTDYGADMKAWPKDVREEYNQRRAEYTGVVAAYNTLAAEYNAKSSSITWESFEGSPPQTIAQYQAK